MGDVGRGLVVWKVSSASVSYGTWLPVEGSITPADLLVRSAGCRLWGELDSATRWQWAGFAFFRACLVCWALYTEKPLARACPAYLYLLVAA